ncbi:hypothetical protein V2J09_021974 [Rumex salicifolius]
MASSYSLINHSIFKCLPCQKPFATPLTLSALTFTGESSLPVDSFCRRDRWGSLIGHVAIRSGGTSSLNAPLEPNSFPGRLLDGVLQNDSDSFYDAVFSELNRLSEDRSSVLARVNLSSGSPEACLHRRIAELKEEEYQPVVEDIMYMLLNKKFLEVGVPLVPNLDKCLYNGRLEILPSNVRELESIHSLDVLEMVREYLTSVIGPKAGSSVMVSRATAKVERLHLSQVYAASVFYGYFLKSASLRHSLERNLTMSYLDIIPSKRWAFLFGSGYYGIKSVALGEFSTPRSTSLSQLQRPHNKALPKLKLYVQGLEQETLQECSKLSKAAMDLVDKHCSALFVVGNSFSVDSDKPILTSLASLKSLILEAIAFGCFLWETEDYVDRVFKLDK